MPPLVLVAVAWVGGLVFAHHWLVPLGVDPLVLLPLGLVPLGALVLYRDERNTRLGAACALAFLLGALRYQLAVPDLTDPDLVSQYNGAGRVTVEGVVVEYPDVGDTRTQLVLETEAVDVAGTVHPVHGRVLVYAPRYPAYVYGDRLRVSGELEAPQASPDFNYPGYLARQGIYSHVFSWEIEKVAGGEGAAWQAALFDVKDRAVAALGRLLPDPEAALLQGIVLGVEGSIPDALYEDFNATGTSHIIVISGANIAVIATLFAGLFGALLGKRRAYLLTLAGIAGYVLLAGADAPVARAGLMGALYVTARHTGRRATAYVSLFAAAAVLTAMTPTALWGAGFQLSFAATLSLCLFTPPLERRLRGRLAGWLGPDRAAWAGRVLSEALVGTIAAQILVLPLIAYHFGRVSPVSPLANLLIVPVQPPIMALGGAAALLALVPFLAPVAQVVAWGPWLCLAYTVAVVRWLAGWPLASVALPVFGMGWLVAYYAALGGLWWLARRARMPGGVARGAARLSLAAAGRARPAFLGVAAVAAVLAWIGAAHLPDGRLHVAFLDVGQGDAILITVPDGRQILVDGGPAPAALMDALGREMPFWDRDLDLVVMTHPDGDHITGLVSVLDRYRVGGWLDAGQRVDDALYAECRARLAGAGVPVRAVVAGDRLTVPVPGGRASLAGEAIAIDVLHPPRGGLAGGEDADNENSVVLRVSWGASSFLLTGDAGAWAEALLLAAGRPLGATVLKAGHHGSAGATTAPFLAAVDPDFAVISAGAGNKFGHPSPEVLDRLAAQGGVTVLRTDEAGTVEFVTDGRLLWVETER